MYTASHVVLEIASQLSRYELSKPQYAATDFELEAFAGEANADETLHVESTEGAADEASYQANAMKGKARDESEVSGSALGKTSSEVESINYEIDNCTINQVEFTRPAVIKANVLKVALPLPKWRPGPTLPTWRPQRIVTANTRIPSHHHHVCHPLNVLSIIGM
jgi:hypothetical protein